MSGSGLIQAAFYVLRDCVVLFACRGSRIDMNHNQRDMLEMVQQFVANRIRDRMSLDNRQIVGDSDISLSMDAMSRTARLVQPSTRA